jgi:5-methylthioadenosine/S-adenosylhomocysteine deaminase
MRVPLQSTKRLVKWTLHQRDMLTLATLGGARAWNMSDEIGTLTVGRRADLAIIDVRSPHLDGFSDPVASLVVGAAPSDVETVIVGGEIVKSGGHLVGSAVEQAHGPMQASRDRLRKRVQPA